VDGNDELLSTILASVLDSLDFAEIRDRGIK